MQRLSHKPWLLVLFLLARILAGDLAFATSSIEPTHAQDHAHCATDASTVTLHSSDDCCKHGHSCECAGASVFAVTCFADSSTYFPPPAAMTASTSFGHARHLTSAQFRPPA